MTDLFGDDFHSLLVQQTCDNFFSEVHSRSFPQSSSALELGHWSRSGLAMERFSNAVMGPLLRNWKDEEHLVHAAGVYDRPQVHSRLVSTPRESSLAETESEEQLDKQAKERAMPVKGPGFWQSDLANRARLASFSSRPKQNKWMRLRPRTAIDCGDSLNVCDEDYELKYNVRVEAPFTHETYIPTAHYK